jgi:6-phosphofructokinase 2
MKPVVTLTLNPAIDGSSEAEAVRPTHKIRTTGERYDPGGGGINVARVIAELGGAASPVYLAGGAAGAVLHELMRDRGFAQHAVPIEGHTRISLAVFERVSGFEYRFVPEGPLVSHQEWESCREVIETLDFDWLVASGSLPRGLDARCYAELAELVAARGARFVLDTSGPALASAIEAGRVHLAKPSLGEFRALTGEPLGTAEAIAAAALDLVSKRNLDMLAVTMGHDGALLATAEGTATLRPPQLPVRSATGAGDSFLGGMVWALASGRSPQEAFVVGVAAGAAAVLTPGTELCLESDIWRVHAMLTA